MYHITALFRVFKFPEFSRYLPPITLHSLILPGFPRFFFKGLCSRFSRFFRFSMSAATLFFDVHNAPTKTTQMRSHMNSKPRFKCLRYNISEHFSTMKCNLPMRGSSTKYVRSKRGGVSTKSNMDEQGRGGGGGGGGALQNKCSLC